MTSYNVVFVPKIKAWGEEIVANYPTKEEAQFKAKWELAIQKNLNPFFKGTFGKGSRYVVRKAK